MSAARILQHQNLATFSTCGDFQRSLISAYEKRGQAIKRLALMQNTAGGDNHGLPRAYGGIRRRNAAMSGDAQHENAKPIRLRQYGFWESLRISAPAFPSFPAIRAWKAR